MKNLLASVLELLEVRISLLALDAKDSASHTISLLVQAVLAAIFLAFGLVFLAVFLTVFFWESQRLWVLGASVVIFIGLAVILAVRIWLRFHRGLNFFDSSVQELRRDRKLLE